MWSEKVALLREANKKFPRDYKIMHKLADSLLGLYIRQETKDWNEIFELCNRILAECTDSDIRYKAINTLGEAYGYAGKKDEMLKLAEEMPNAHFSYENFMLYRWNGDADFEKRQTYIFYLINQLTETISSSCSHHHDDGKMIYSEEERIELYKLEVKLLELLFPDKDYYYLAQNGEIACGHIAMSFLRGGDLESAFEWIEKSVDFAINMDTYDFDAPHTSLILRGFVFGGWIMEKDGNNSQNLLEWLTTNDEALVLRSNARYEALVKKLKKVAKKP